MSEAIVVAKIRRTTHRELGKHAYHEIEITLRNESDEACNQIGGLISSYDPKSNVIERQKPGFPSLLPGEQSVTKLPVPEFVHEMAARVVLSELTWIQDGRPESYRPNADLPVKGHRRLGRRTDIVLGLFFVAGIAIAISTCSPP